MKRAIVCLGLIALTGCADVTARLGKAPAPAGIDQAVVIQLVCHGIDAGRYITERGGSNADVTERSWRAEEEIRSGQLRSDQRFADCCPSPGCAWAKPAISPLPSPSPSPEVK